MIWRLGGRAGTESFDELWGFMLTRSQYETVRKHVSVLETSVVKKWKPFWILNEMRKCWSFHLYNSTETWLMIDRFAVSGYLSRKVYKLGLHIFLVFITSQSRRLFSRANAPNGCVPGFSLRANRGSTMPSPLCRGDCKCGIQD